jgi:Fe2+ or Zn2+ uptake regulation protein
MKNKEEILKAIEYYDVYTPQGRSVLKTIIAAAGEDYSAKLTINSLSELSKVSRQGIYNCMRYIEKDKFLETKKTSGRKITVFELNPSKLNEVLEYYNTLKATKNSLEKI